MECLVLIGIHAADMSIIGLLSLEKQGIIQSLVRVGGEAAKQRFPTRERGMYSADGTEKTAVFVKEPQRRGLQQFPRWFDAF
jgi:hypothetical protein